MDLFAFKVGPYFEVPLNKTFSFSLDGGLAVVYVYSRFHFNEVVATPGGAIAVNGHGVNDGVGSHARPDTCSGSEERDAGVEPLQCRPKYLALAAVSVTSSSVPSIAIRRRPEAKAPGVSG